jgi:pimeloyl-ACP methyl ester carboxylesterase
MNDVVVLLPGILGSVLQKDGQDLWAFEGGGLYAALRARSGLARQVHQLRLQGDDPDVDDLGDGIVATRLMPGAHYVYGLVKVDGYAEMRNQIVEHYQVTPAGPDDATANFFEFPYDWRRDNRVAARQLKRLIDHRLPQWRTRTYNPNAKVILLAHSMGGLVARYYLEVLGGWRDCRALITFVTPHRGSINALNFLANGYKEQGVDFTDVLRSCTAIYQLLPIYEMVDVSGTFHRVAEIDGIPNVSRERAAQALSFHRQIEAAVKARAERGYVTIPVVGTDQPTLQSAELAGGHLSASEWVPDHWPTHLADGDGTVPYVSAIPIELSEEYRETYLAARHATVQNNPLVWKTLHKFIQRMQEPLLEAVRGPEPRDRAAEPAAISLYLNDLYLTGEPIELQAALVRASGFPELLEADVCPVAGNASPSRREFQKRGDKWILDLNDVSAGLYRIEVRTRYAGPNAPSPVQDLFEVAPRN